LHCYLNFLASGAIISKLERRANNKSHFWAFMFLKWNKQETCLYLKNICLMFLKCVGENILHLGANGITWTTPAPLGLFVGLL
jgi:hypothetical protein